MGLFQTPPVAETRAVTVSDAAITLALENNTWYTFSSSSITSITLTVATGFIYAGADFVTPSTAPTFSAPATWAFQGDDCENAVFTPLSNTHYRIAMEIGFGTVIVTVQSCDMPTT